MSLPGHPRGECRKMRLEGTRVSAAASAASFRQAGFIIQA